MTPARSALFALFLLTIANAAAFAQRPTAAELDRSGWAAVRANRLQEAADAFREGLRLEPRNVRLMLGAAVTAHLLGRAEEARQQLVAVLQLQPSLTDASILLGQILYRDGDLSGAIQTYEQALVHAPDNQVLTANLETWRKEIALHDKFTQRFGDHFTAMFEGPKEEALAARIIEMLEASYWRIGTALGAYPNGILTVVLYTNEQFRDVTRSPTWAVASFDGRIRVPMRGAVENPQELDRVLAHEFTHALIYSSLREVFRSGSTRGSLSYSSRTAAARRRTRPGRSFLSKASSERSTASTMRRRAWRTTRASPLLRRSSIARG